MHSTVTVLEYCITVHLKSAERVDLKCSYCTHTNENGRCKLIVVVISQCVSISKHHLVHLKYIQLLNFMERSMWHKIEASVKKPAPS